MVILSRDILAIQVPARRLTAFAFLTILCGSLYAQLTPKQKADNLESFEIVWRTVRDRHPDPKLNGLDWQAIHDSTRPRIEKAASMQEVRSILTAMLEKLESSHYAIIPAEAYSREDSPAPETPSIAGSEKPADPAASPAAPQAASAAESEKTSNATPQVTSPEGVLVTFGNLPATRLRFDSRTLADGAGYIRFNEFLEPASIMPKFEAAMKNFHDAPGVILDLRGNPGGIGIMAMGIAGFFIDKPGQKLGEMRMRDATLSFVISPRPETYAGPLAILVNQGSASTSEILAGGLQDLGRARIFGVRTMGAALPSDIIRLPNGDGFQYAQASYTSIGGKVLEGAGVTPDVVVEQTSEATAAGRDLILEAADEWIRATRH